MASLASMAKSFPADEASDSNSSDFALQRIGKRARFSDFTAKFKGVVPQQNGRWGAQIYANHQRIWLGTFRSEAEAAAAYDSASVKLRSRDSHRNFPWTSHTIEEPNFQSRFSTDDVLNMIKDGSYSSKFAAFLRSQRRGGETEENRAIAGGHGGDFSCSHLFQKELTPSDVGKLNRLVIPKKYAVKHFPYINEEESGAGAGTVDDIELVFYDTGMRAWKFRYCYWKSSQSFVFTRGWNRFVKEKKLKAQDIITFYGYENEDQKGQIFQLIDVIYKRSEESWESNCLPGEKYSNGGEIALELKLGRILRFEKVGDQGEEEGTKKKEVLSELYANQNVGQKRIRLFGVQIN